ncbi:ABC transporter permease [Solimicrobium silvestre]|uniref:ABC-type Fe3+ transport system permease component n=1 Tax=Solimicrobium silvestre TaxID=2099400 RepID=A0A2S9H5S5_9BURK|nr:iron ABC transporter permease [Solimicrobium silvestre]PRC95283.1 ABC-type Fe3+ transport system permease component [Solimicrobium silvestre]
MLFSVFTPETEIWAHLQTYVLPELISNTLWLVLGVVAGTALLGVALAWLTAVCEFPGRTFFSWALMLPLAIPAYVAAFVAIGLFDFTGPLQTMLRDLTGGRSAWFPPIRSLGGAILILSLSLYPYVYLLARQAFLTQGSRALEAGQSLGLTRRMGFFRIALPMARPWIAAGLMLVVMETLADFGAVSIFNVDTFSTAIYKTWFGLFSLSAASQLASLLLLAILILVFAEQYWQRQRRYHSNSPDNSASKRIQLSPQARWYACAFAAVIFASGFVIPVTQLLAWSSKSLTGEWDQRFAGFVWHTVLLSSMAAGMVVLAALVLVITLRRHHDWPTRFFVRLATLGYAIPGTVLAVGIFIPAAWLDQQFFDISGHMLLRGSLALMLCAYLARFLAPAFNTLDSAMQRITKNQEDAARGLGLTGWRLFSRLYFPMLRGGILGAALLVFVDVMKEMPITLMTRPFGWDTLAVRIFEMTSEGQWEHAALPALAIVVIGLLPVFLLIRPKEFA